MFELKSSPAIRLRGVRHNNLKNFDLDLPLHRLIVVTGLSGSGKSSLAFDTLYAEGQRRYIETFSPYARQFFDRMDKPQVDSIEGIPPAIAIEQRNAVRTTRSTVGTMTEICDHMKVLWPHIAQLHCRGCGKVVRKDSPLNVWQSVNDMAAGREVLITFDLPISEKLSLADSLALIAKQGFQRILCDGKMVRIEDAGDLVESKSHAAITVIQDRIKIASTNRARFIEACEQAYHFGKGLLAVRPLDATGAVNEEKPRLFSNRLHCAQCNIEYREPSPALFSFNHPLGACPNCKGFGRIITIDYNLAIPDRTLTLAEGAVKPWRTGTGAESQADMAKFCKKLRVPMNVPFMKMSPEHQRWVIDGDKDYGIDESHQWPRAWYGVKGYFKWLESKSYKMHVRVLLSRYRAYTKCPECGGQRLNPEAQLYFLDVAASRQNAAIQREKSAALFRDAATKLTLADFYALPARDALTLIEELQETRKTKNISRNDPVTLVLSEVHARLAYLNEVGLGYLTLDRPTRGLSGGETERVNLTTCLGTRLVNTLFVLDEPSVGLHPRDTERLVKILTKLRDNGNTVLVVEHESSVMKAADQIVDIGPGHGASGGDVVFQGTFKEILRSKESLTGQYLSGRKEIEVPERRTTESKLNGGTDGTTKLHCKAGALPNAATLKVSNVTRHNLENVSVSIPLKRFVSVTGVSGSGKSTLVREVLYPALAEKLNERLMTAKLSDRIDDDPPSPEGFGATGEEDDALCGRSEILTGYESISRVVMVDQSSLGKTPRSNPAVYIGAFDDIREVFAQSEIAKRLGFNASAFSFNSGVGQCERCRGAGFEKIEMQFLSDVFIRCGSCNGRRYRPHILEVKIASDASASSKHWSIGDLLEATVDETIEFLAGFANSKPAQRAVASLKLLQEVGLGYLRLGQPINTLSGGESQRLKLVQHLAESATGESAGSTLFLFDEPTTGLHFEDIRILLKVFQRLVDAGHSLVVIEHNLDVIKCADWVIDLGPDAGDRGGKIVVEGTPETVARCEASHTGSALKAVLSQSKQERIAK
jgi:excinuclease ABC subunit A